MCDSGLGGLIARAWQRCGSRIGAPPAGTPATQDWADQTRRVSPQTIKKYTNNLLVKHAAQRSRSHRQLRRSNPAALVFRWLLDELTLQAKGISGQLPVRLRPRLPLALPSLIPPY